MDTSLRTGSGIYSNALFIRTHQLGLLTMAQCFSLTTKQPQPAYQPQKSSAEQHFLQMLHAFSTNTIKLTARKPKATFI